MTIGLGVVGVALAVAMFFSPSQLIMQLA